MADLQTIKLLVNTPDRVFYHDDATFEKKRIIITLEKSDRISSAFIVFVPNKSLIIALIRFFGLRFFSLLGMYFIISTAQ